MALENEALFFAYNMCIVGYCGFEYELSRK